MKRWIQRGVLGGMLLGSVLPATALPWPERASWNYCMEFGMAAERIANIRDRAASKGFTIETARNMYTYGTWPSQIGWHMHEALVTDIYPSTQPKEKMAERYAMTCIKRYGLRPPSHRPSRVIILEYDR